MSAVRTGEEPPIDDVIERVLTTYGFMRSLTPVERARARERTGAYLAMLHAAGHTDARRLAVFGLAYLKTMHDRPDPRFTGC
ncbi:hypothetical protein JQ557_15530 [Bradyrhizobium sp. U87765 SZCCT0131]|uniref:hypothetical protein n=1 Tax=unclassified Bradyrhizobium TaxID=2631580 RepID=UPI001BACFB33|nr:MULTISPECIES: hypothetical protein [unclassified Bradyrhizobium]MBR1219414.1 hypothetical protein [Bradyrhizobium sp. U87765 SZCCT0131]MBR1262065.1 hypothetical protein [Bradyrhizobium sp. U87765 SZCCT0134]MBR1306082.1 hypothetical protein [Bradyrhizobium sp. U87765 SZCCT0110]MBR1317847.1 hypothetical protein [Bradyrhizobium sp. U87765 SZCCT0109]MBR1351549.1 hypothetical protein [Bradyrhizobium sp. U87765 SZCCT0048]